MNKECQSKEDGVCNLPIGTCEQCKPSELQVYKSNLEVIYTIVFDMKVSESHRTMIHQLCKNAFNGKEFKK